MDRWEEIRTAYAVARLGTVSAAADELGVHRATVVRHIDALEEALGGKLFERLPQGYTPTPAGLDMMRVAGATEAQFRDLEGRTRGSAAAVSGELLITTIEILAPLLMPAIVAFRSRHEDTSVRLTASGRVFKLEYGEAHVAVRAGARPSDPDNVVLPYPPLRSGLYAHRSYMGARGAAGSDVAQHDFVCDTATDSLTWQWLQELAPTPRVVFSSRRSRLNLLAIDAGLGVGFYPEALATKQSELVPVVPPRDAWDIPCWVVTHVDLHWTPKVRAIVEHLRSTVPQRGAL